MRKEMVVLVSLVAVVVSGCGAAMTSNPWDDGRVMLAGDAPGINALFGGLNGLNDKDRGEKYYLHRGIEEQERTERAKCGALQQLFHGCGPRAAARPVSTGQAVGGS